VKRTQRRKGRRTLASRRRGGRSSTYIDSGVWVPMKRYGVCLQPTSFSRGKIQNYAIVSQEALERWIDKHAILSALHVESELQSISISDILCSHNLYDYNKAGIMKRITLVSFSRHVELAITDDV
jgi:hypothetical protein